jgi:hypothetical protein
VLTLTLDSRLAAEDRTFDLRSEAKPVISSRMCPVVNELAKEVVLLCAVEVSVLALSAAVVLVRFRVCVQERDVLVLVVLPCRLRWRGFD